jgi:hypothetical protein
MRFIGVIINIAGWLIAMSGLFFSQSNAVRLAFAVVGICVSLFGIFGVMNKYYLQNANWKK